MATDLMFPARLWPSEESVTAEDGGTFTMPPMHGAAVTQRVQGAEPKLVVKQTYKSLSQDDRSTLVNFMRQVQGKYRGVWLSPQRFQTYGNWQPTEVFTQAALTVTSGWNPQNATLSVVPSGIRVRNTKGSGGSNFAVSQNVSITSADIYALRSFTTYPSDVNSNVGGQFVPFFNAQANYQTGSLGWGMRDHVGYANSYNAGATYPNVSDTNGTVSKAGEYVDLQYASFARCLQVDGGINNLLNTASPGASNWVKSNASVGAYLSTGPNGAVDAHDLRCNSSGVIANYRLISTTSKGAGAEDWTGVAELKAGNKPDALLLIGDVAANQYAYVYANLNSGTLSGGPSQTSSVRNIFHRINSLGAGWWEYSVTARFPAGITNSLALVISVSTGGGSENFVASSGDFIRFRNLGLAQSPVPMRFGASSTAVNTGTVYGSDAIYVKGGPRDVLNALKEGQLIEVSSGELVQLTNDVDFDGLGRALVRFRPTLFRPAVNDGPVHVTRPFGRFILRNNVEVMNKLGHYADVELEFEQVYE